MLCMESKEKVKLLREYLPPKSRSQEELGKEVGASTSTVGHWELGRSISTRHRASMNQLWGIPPEFWEDDDMTKSEVIRYLQNLSLKDEGPNVKAKHPDNLNRTEEAWREGNRYAVPVWRGVAAGDPDLDECYFDDDATERREVPAAFIVGDPEKHVMGIASGMSMSPRISHAERILLRLDPDVPPGHLVIARSPESRNYIKRLVKNDQTLELHSINPDYKPITRREGWHILGGVVVIWHTYEKGVPNIEFDEGRWLP
jgi:SOS-response transcriptional repressor LexA